MRVVLDTNVYISFLLTRGETISRVLDGWENEEFSVLVSPALLAEIRRVLGYSHLKTRIKPEEAQALLDALDADALLMEGTTSIVAVTTDPKDDMVVACAVEGKADYLISGDPHLLELGRSAETRIISPAEFAQLLGAIAKLTE